MADGGLFGPSPLRGLQSVDLFAGGGGASLGIQRASGLAPFLAVNHNAAAIAMHARNHPETAHLCESVFDVSPLDACRGRPVGLLWASPDCTHFSRAKGGKPRDKAIRGLAWVIVDWAREIRPPIICMENVPEFVTWGPLVDGQADKGRAGETFREFVQALEGHGYAVSWRVLCAADYGAPTSRRRLFLVARRDGLPIVWPDPTHGPGRLPHRTAAECIDWSIPVPSIFGRKRELAEATQRRIAAGIVRYVLGAARPFIVTTGHQSSDAGKVRPVDAPLSTVVTKGEHLLVSPCLVGTGHGEREGQAPRCQDIRRPLGTVVATAQNHALVAAFLARAHSHGWDVNGSSVRPMDRPAWTVTAKDGAGVAAVFLDKLHKSARCGVSIDQPAPTVTAGGGKGGGHAGLVAAFLARYYGQGGQWSALDAPMPTVTTLDRMAVVTVAIDGEPYVLADIGMRMLQPRELARAQGFPDSYWLPPVKSDAVARIGNSVCPPVAEALVRAQLGNEAAMAAK